VAIVLYALLFLSGAAALTYEVAWVRSLSLVFGGSHLAVTTVLSVFMGGLALGSRLFGRRADETDRPLRLYAFLEIGIAAFALLFLGLVRLYPTLYPPLARAAEDSRLYLSALRVLFAVAAMLGPTTLMGGTLPVLARCVATHPATAGRRVAFLYGLNTIGAVAGALAAGFHLLPSLGVTRTVLLAVGANLAIGLVARAIPERTPAPLPPPPVVEPAGGAPAIPRRALRSVVWGIGVSGFCALGYEVLWTRMLSLVLSTSVYSFTLILVAFLSGIGLGSAAFGLLGRHGGGRGSVAAFGLVQVAIGLAALSVTVLMRNLPSGAAWVEAHVGLGPAQAGPRAAFAVAFAYLVGPAFLMGLAFPLAGSIHASARGVVGSGVGEVLTSNTIGSILGAALSGFVLIHALGMERSLQVLAILNAGAGVVVATSLLRPRGAPWAAAAALAALLAARVAWGGWGLSWDQRAFAVWRTSLRDVYASPEKKREALENTDVLYYFEGVNEIISVVRPRGGVQGFVVNGRPEASTTPADVQCQRTLGHLPMLLHPDPRRVFVLGTGTGMTLGAVSLHRSVERIVLAEIEPGVLGATRTFASYNHAALDDPRLRVVFNDGRNFLATTTEKFDVVTSDPIHPGTGGAAYLYTREYFRAVADHLRPGGVAAHWLPIYELTPHDVQTVLRTFAETFAHVMVWLTHYDAELVGSDRPLVVDEAALERRLADPAIRADLAAVDMGSAEDFLAYFLMGDARARDFARAGGVNTDDNLLLEFSAPASMGLGHLQGDNARALSQARESLLPYLDPAPGPGDRARWERNLAAARLYDPAHALALWGEQDLEPYRRLETALQERFPDYAPYRFLRAEVARARAATPALAGQVDLPVAAGAGGRPVLRISAVAQRTGETRALVSLVDHEKRLIYGRRYLDGEGPELDAAVREFVASSLDSVRRAYDQLAADGRRRGAPLPTEREVADLLRAVIPALTAPAGPGPARQ